MAGGTDKVDIAQWINPRNADFDSQGKVCSNCRRTPCKNGQPVRRVSLASEIILHFCQNHFCHHIHHHCHRNQDSIVVSVVFWLSWTITVAHVSESETSRLVYRDHQVTQLKRGMMVITSDSPTGPCKGMILKVSTIHQTTWAFVLDTLLSDHPRGRGGCALHPTRRWRDDDDLRPRRAALLLHQVTDFQQQKNWFSSFLQMNSFEILAFNMSI